MKRYVLPAIAEDAVATSTTRPATALAHDSEDARLVVFRLRPGQVVPPHTSPSTVILSVVSGTGIVSGGDGEVAVHAGDVVTFDPREPHGMRATTDELVLLATITPRPGIR